MSPDPDLLVLAFALPDTDVLTAIVINQAEEPTSARIASEQGPAWTVSDATTSTEGSYAAPAEVDESGTLSLPGRSLTSLRLFPL